MNVATNSTLDIEERGVLQTSIYRTYYIHHNEQVFFRLAIEALDRPFTVDGDDRYLRPPQTTDLESLP